MSKIIEAGVIYRCNKQENKQKELKLWLLPSVVMSRLTLFKRLPSPHHEHKALLLSAYCPAYCSCVLEIAVCCHVWLIGLTMSPSL